MGRRQPNKTDKISELKTKIKQLQGKLAKADTHKQPPPEEMAIIDRNFKRALRKQIRLMQTKDQEAKRQKLLNMTDFAP